MNVSGSPLRFERSLNYAFNSVVRLRHVSDKVYVALDFARPNTTQGADMRTPRKLAIAAASIGLLLPLVAVTEPASAATTGTQIVSFNKLFTFKSYSQSRCVQFRVTGYISFHTSVQTVSRVTYYTIVSPTVNAPKMVTSVSGLNQKTGTCASTATVSRISVGQHWSGYACSYNPAISFGAGIPTISFWPSCGNKVQAVFDSSYGAGGGWTQEAVDVNFESVQRASIKPTAPCYGVFVSAHAYVGSVDKFYGTNDGNSDGAASICLNPTWP